MEEVKNLETINYQPMIEQNDVEQENGEQTNHIDLDQTQGPQPNVEQQDVDEETQINIEKTNKIKSLEIELNELEKINLQTLNLSENQLQCIMLIKSYEAGIIEQQFNDAKAAEDANLPQEIRQQLGNSSQLSESSSKLETIQEEQEESVNQQEDQPAQELQYYQQENKQVDNSIVSPEKKIVRPAKPLPNPMQNIKLSKFEQYTKKKKFSQLYNQKIDESGVYKINAFGRNSVNFGIQSESENKDNLAGSIFDHINQSEPEQDLNTQKDGQVEKEQNNDVTDI